MRRATDNQSVHAMQRRMMHATFRSRMLKVMLLVMVWGLIAWPRWSESLPGRRSVGPVAMAVHATVETEPVASPGDAADDPAIWRHPSDGGQSTIIGTDKKRGLVVYDMSGRVLQELPDGRMGNVDLRHGFPLGGAAVAIVAAGNRSDDTIAIYAVDPTTRRLRNVAGRRLEAAMAVYGSCMYRSRVDGAFYVFVTSKRGEVAQWQLRATGQGTVDAERVRSFELGSQIEACVADDESGDLYIGEERVGIWKYPAEPSAGVERVLVDSTAPTGWLTPDVEGLAIWYGVQGTGYLIASTQGSDGFNVYRREGRNEYLASFKVAAGNGIDEVTHSDGVDVLSGNLGPGFPDGLLVAQDQKNDGARQNFKLVPWSAIRDVIRSAPNAPNTARSVPVSAVPNAR